MRTLIAVLTALLFFTGLYSPSFAKDEALVVPQGDIAAPVFKTGDTWVDSVGGKEMRMVVVALNGDKMTINWYGKEYTMTLEGNAVAGLSGGFMVQWSPHRGDVSFPLKPGKKWTHEYTWTSSAGGQGVGTTYGKAGDWETVTVPAGTFRALRLVLEYSWESHTNRSNRGYEKQTCWYAPEVKRYVKCKGDQAVELMRYEPAK